MLEINSSLNWFLKSCISNDKTQKSNVMQQKRFTFPANISCKIQSWYHLCHCCDEVRTTGDHFTDWTKSCMNVIMNWWEYNLFCCSCHPQLHFFHYYILFPGRPALEESKTGIVKMKIVNIFSYFLSKIEILAHHHLSTSWFILINP